ncbi:hypothetical protein PR048_006420 [Dryococelus australis]|uniref:Reverse transcriptase/retrotransposon-derived protein RNase H-like domain-containing protein n=1 Tax=Dryococelus australis TaxID=614101 RepID=A0ABQ9IAX5_9NEOP|nr:hypothetical protein PR048_006420 [Dryococelus australis]
MHWGTEQETVFSTLKEKLLSPPAVHLPDFFPKRFVVQVDASSLALDVVLNQQTEHGLAPVAFTSRSLTETDHKLGMYKEETLACIFRLEKVASYMEHEE